MVMTLIKSEKNNDNINNNIIHMVKKNLKMRQNAINTSKWRMKYYKNYAFCSYLPEINKKMEIFIC